MRSNIISRKENHNEWLVWNKITGDCVSIFTTDEMFMGHHKTLYTVVYRGVRVGVMIEHFQTAMSAARNHIS